jgi:hypothetical protein
MTTTKTDIDALRDKILRLKKNLNTIILARNYQRPEVQDIAGITMPCLSQEALFPVRFIGKITVYEGSRSSQ